MSKKNRLQGKISIHTKGFGFLSADCGHEDIFIPASKINGAFDGDVVVVSSLKKSAKGWEGIVESIKQQNRKRIVGTVVDHYPNGDAMIFSASAGEERPLCLKKSPKTKFEIGDRVSLNIKSQGTDNSLTCTLHKFLGNINDALIDSDVAIEEYNLHEKFPAAVIAEAEKFKEGCVLTKDRVDYRDLECLTIDPTTARDYDDALSITKDKNGCYQLGVHIADVSHFVKENSKLDLEAQSRGNSTYFIDKVVPMLPENLSNGLCSLKEGVDRYTATVMMEFDTKGILKSHEICKSIIRSRKRFTYEEAKQVLDKKIKSPHLNTLKLLVELCSHLKRQKKERGCVELNLPEIRLVLDENGIPYTETWIEYDITHQLVEEYMLKANEIVASELLKRGGKGLFRIHENPDPETLNEFFTLARLFGYVIPPNATSEDIGKIFEDAKDSVNIDQLSIRYIRSMKLAVYSKDNIGHYGLNLENYTHFTSPIRRYSDLVVHRFLFDKDYNPNEKAIAELCSETERRSFRAEMSVARLKKLRYLDRLTEDDPDFTFEATITNIKPQGIFFDLNFIGFEGNIHVSQLGDEYFYFNEKDRSFKGSTTNERYQIGTKLVVSLESIDLVFGECTWNLIH